MPTSFSFKTLTFLALLSLCAQASVDNGVSLIYQGKPEEALRELAPDADKGDAKAAFYSSLILLFGDNPKPDEGLEMLEKAVHKGYGPALDTYAGLFLHGEFKPMDHHKALMYYEIAAVRGYGPSQFNCGIMYKNGEKLPRDLVKAFVFLNLATLNEADLGDVAEDAAHYRNEVVAAMTKEQYAQAMAEFVRVSEEIKAKKIQPAN